MDPPQFVEVRSHNQPPYNRKDGTYGSCQILVFLSLVVSIFALFIHTHIQSCVCVRVIGRVISILCFKAPPLLSTRFLVLFFSSPISYAVFACLLFFFATTINGITS